MLLMKLKFRVLYLVSHWHYLMMRKQLEKQNNFLGDYKKFRNAGKKFLYHVKRFDDMQRKLDEIKSVN